MGARQSSASTNSVTPDSSSKGTQPIQGFHGHDFTLQAVMEMQKSLGSLETSVNNLATQIGSQKQTMDDLKKKVTNIEKIMYAAGLILLITLGIGGWMLTAAKDFAMTYYKASLEAQTKAATHPVAPTQPIASKIKP